MARLEFLNSLLCVFLARASLRIVRSFPKRSDVFEIICLERCGCSTLERKPRLLITKTTVYSYLGGGLQKLNREINIFAIYFKNVTLVFYMRSIIVD